MFTYMPTSLKHVPKTLLQRENARCRVDMPSEEGHFPFSFSPCTILQWQDLRRKVCWQLLYSALGSPRLLGSVEA